MVIQSFSEKSQNAGGVCWRWEGGCREGGGRTGRGRLVGPGVWEGYHEAQWMVAEGSGGRGGWGPAQRKRAGALQTECGRPKVMRRAGCHEGPAREERKRAERLQIEGGPVWAAGHEEQELGEWVALLVLLRGLFVEKRAWEQR